MAYRRRFSGRKRFKLGRRRFSPFKKTRRYRSKARSSIRPRKVITKKLVEIVNHTPGAVFAQWAQASINISAFPTSAQYLSVFSRYRIRKVRVTTYIKGFRNVVFNPNNPPTVGQPEDAALMQFGHCRDSWGGHGIQPTWNNEILLECAGGKLTKWGARGQRYTFTPWIEARYYENLTSDAFVPKKAPWLNSSDYQVSHYGMIEFTGNYSTYATELEQRVEAWVDFKNPI